MTEFKQYRRKQIAELRKVDAEDINEFRISGKLLSLDGVQISISEADLNNGSPKLGDMIARNPKSYKDQWLVAKDYFNDNFELVE